MIESNYIMLLLVKRCWSWLLMISLLCALTNEIEAISPDGTVTCLLKSLLVFDGTMTTAHYAVDFHSFLFFR